MALRTVVFDDSDNIPKYKKGTKLIPIGIDNILAAEQELTENRAIKLKEKSLSIGGFNAAGVESTIYILSDENTQRVFISIGNNTIMVTKDSATINGKQILTVE